MKTKFLLSTLFLLVYLGSNAQNRRITPTKNSVGSINTNIQNPVTTAKRECGTSQVLENDLKNDPNLASRMEKVERDISEWIKNSANNKSGAVVTIPVVFQVVYKNASENLSAARLNDQLAVLTKDFRKLNSDAGNVPAPFQGVAADIEIEFCLATTDPNGNPTNGIIRTATTTASFGLSNEVKATATGGVAPWNTSKYLNIWVCDITGSVLGYAQFPGGSSSTDGIVMDYAYTGVQGSTAPYNLGRTATHEVGHYLGLVHIWGDANCGDDQVSDTPPQSSPTGGCPTFPVASTCVGSNANGNMFMNYMDYSNDACLYMFTTGQKQRMLAALNTNRASLLTANVCAPVIAGPGCDTLLETFFTNNYNLNLYLVSEAGQNGYVSGNNSYGDKAKAEKISTFVAGSKVKGAIFYFAIANTGNANDVITAKVWNSGGTGGKPGAVLGSKTAKIIDIAANVNLFETTYIEFPVLIPVTGPFYVGTDLNNTPGDTVAIITTSDGDVPAGANSAWEQQASNVWYPYSEPSPTGWGLDLKHFIFPVMCTTVGIGEILQESNVSVFPNPVNQNLSVVIGKDVKNSSVLIYNLLGQQVAPATINNSGKLTYSVDVSNLTPGVYFIQVKTELGNITRKFVKE